MRCLTDSTIYTIESHPPQCKKTTICFFQCPSKKFASTGTECLSLQNCHFHMMRTENNGEDHYSIIYYIRDVYKQICELLRSISWVPARIYGQDLPSHTIRELNGLSSEDYPRYHVLFIGCQDLLAFSYFGSHGRSPMESQCIIYLTMDILRPYLQKLRN